MVVEEFIPTQNPAYRPSGIKRDTVYEGITYGLPNIVCSMYGVSFFNKINVSAHHGTGDSSRL